MHYRTEFEILGLPLVEVRTGDMVAGRYERGVARAWIAVGDVALGVLVSVGGIAVGGLAIGGLAVSGDAALGGLLVEPARRERKDRTALIGVNHDATSFATSPRGRGAGTGNPALPPSRARCAGS